MLNRVEDGGRNGTLQCYSIENNPVFMESDRSHLEAKRIHDRLFEYEKSLKWEAGWNICLLVVIFILNAIIWALSGEGLFLDNTYDILLDAFVNLGLAILVFVFSLCHYIAVKAKKRNSENGAYFIYPCYIEVIITVNVVTSFSLLIMVVLVLQHYDDDWRPVYLYVSLALPCISIFMSILPVVVYMIHTKCKSSVYLCECLFCDHIFKTRCC